MYDKLISFQKYSIGVNNILSDGRPVNCKTYLVFTEKYRANHFILNVSKQCKYKKAFRAVGIFPIVVDAFDKKVFEKSKLFDKFSESNQYSIF